MVKYLFIVINSFVLFVYGLFSGDNGITVKANMPSQMVIGQETTIEIVVNKGAMNGFAKLQVDLPQGIVIKESEEKGATYTVNDNIAKWVWAALPSESEIIIKMVVTATEGSAGAKALNAKYSYVENNVKQVVEMVPVEFTVTGSSEAITSATTATTEVPAAAVTPAGTDSAGTAPITSNIENPGNITVSRTKLPEGVSSEYTISISISKGATKGFARYSDDMPKDAIITEAKTDGASFSIADDKIKFVWVNVPEKEMLDISYVVSSKVAQTMVLKGEYSYLEDNQSKKFELKEESLVFEMPQALAAGTKSAEPFTTQSVAPEGEKPLAEAKKSTSKPAKTKAPKQTQPQPVGNQDALMFNVQIGAFSRRKVTVAKLEKKFNVTESIRSDMQGGYTKFMVGSHTEYKEARDHRDTMISSNGIKSSFVVAYNHGKRITVQEALMITNQKWFK
jgi:cell division septation protein DedD